MPTEVIKKGAIPVLITTIATSVVLYVMGWAGADFMRSHDTSVEMPYIKNQLTVITKDLEDQNMKMDTMMVFIGENRTDIRVIEATMKAKNP